MAWRSVFPLLLVLTSPAGATLPQLGALPASRLCRPAILAAERSFAIPDHLLAAIAHVESGRRDPVSGSFDPWPWTINADGQGSFYDTKAEAVAAVQAMRARGVRSIDVGCMQISLLHHPDAFASLDQAFDPSANATYGARFLTELHTKANAWPRAVELYHSATPELGQQYGRLVYAALPAEQRLAGSGPMDNLSAAWAATLNRASVTAAFPPSPARIISGGGGLPGAGAGAAMGGLGRGLDSYRSAPVRLAMRAP
jgi:Transglycosylase SLT domain